MNSLKLFVVCTIATVVVAGCSSRSTIPLGGDAEGFGSNGGGQSGASTSATGAEGGIGVFPEGSAGAQADLLKQLVVYFDFDTSDIRSDFNAMLAAHGQYLAANPNAQVRLEGHADERGSREYNIGLGERRAQAVRRILLLQGASADQLSTVSYGEERPAAFGSDEEAYRLNRRVELVYR